MPNKRGRVPAIGGLILPNTPVLIRKLTEGPIKAVVDVPTCVFESIKRGESAEIMIPVNLPNEMGKSLSRFLAKVGVEALAQRLEGCPGGQDYIVDEGQFDPVRRHARLGETAGWPVNMRWVYQSNAKWLDQVNSQVQVVFEYDFLRTEENELYFVLALFGVEFALNMAGPDIDGYCAWLARNQNVSPLCSGKNSDDLRLRRPDV